MKLVDLIPDADALLALEPDELGLRLLPVLANFRHPGMTLQPSYVFPSIVGDDRHSSCPGQYPPNRRQEITVALTEAWAWLEGQALLVRDPGWVGLHEIRMLSRKARRLAEEPDPRRVFSARRIPKDSLDPRIREDVWALYHRGEYELAIIAAMKAVEVRVREVGGFTNADHGKDMIARAFNSKSGTLRDETAEPAERDALFALMTGAFGLYRNPYVHRNMGQDDPDEAAEIIMLANHLLRIIDVREAALRTSP
jgi:uncharacterized protein (TIGR02391 family)